MLTFCTCLLGASALAAPPDTATRPQPAHQVVKLGARVFLPENASVSYERQLSKRWALLGGLGYLGYTSSGYSIYPGFGGEPVYFPYSTQNRLYMADVQVRYYLSGRARPLTGWYLGANLHTTFSTAREEHSFPERNTTRQGLSGQLELQLGRQWALGRRFTLDTYLGMSVYRQRTRYGLGTAVPGTMGAGVQFGYRFRPAPQRRP